MTDDPTRLKFGDRALVVVVALVAACTVIFAGMVAQSILAGSLTPALASSGFPFASLLMAASVGLLQLTKPFDAAHPRYLPERAASASARVKGVVGRITGR